MDNSHQKTICDDVQVSERERNISELREGKNEEDGWTKWSESSMTIAGVEAETKLE